MQECWLAKLYSFNAPFRSANRSQIQALVGLTFLPLLADLPDALPLQVLGAYLGVDHDPLVLEQHYDVGAAEHEEAELIALLQPGSDLWG